MPVSPLKTILPIAALFVFIQGIAEVCRCIICIRQGSWPERQKDVEETEDAIIRMMHEREELLEHQLHIDEHHEEEKPEEEKPDDEKQDESGGESR